MGALGDALKRRILTVDLERLPGLAPVWDQRTNFIPARQWRRMPSTLCYSARWYGTKRVLFAAAWDGHEQMVRSLWTLFDEADLVLTYNGRRADIPWARGDWLKYGLPQPRPWKDLDIYVHGKQFGFPSRSLDHLCQQLGVEGKRGHYDMDVAERAFNGHRASQRELRSYNVGDLDALDRCYERMRAFLYNHPHLSKKVDDQLRCNRCTSTDLEKLPSDYLAVQIEYRQYRCRACGGVVRAAHSRRVANTRGVS